MSEDVLTYSVPAIHCGHCEAALRKELEPIPGVGSVDVDLERKQVSVHGVGLDDAVLRAALDEAGFDAAV